MCAALATSRQSFRQMWLVGYAAQIGAREGVGTCARAEDERSLRVPPVRPRPRIPAEYVGRPPAVREHQPEALIAEWSCDPYEV